MSMRHVAIVQDEQAYYHRIAARIVCRLIGTDPNEVI
jgi:hypothetical protein